MESVAHHRFATLVEPHLPALRAYVDRRAPELSDDVMQELGVVAWRRLADLPAGHERAWLFGVARMVLLAERRRYREQQAGLADDESTLRDAAAPSALSPLLTPPVADALSRLSDRDRELLLLTAWEGLSTTEAARSIGIRPTAARMGLVRARRRLAAALDDLDPGWDGRKADPKGAPATSTASSPPKSTDHDAESEEHVPCDAAHT